MPATSATAEVRRQLAALAPASRALDWDGRALGEALQRASHLGGRYLDSLASGDAVYGPGEPALGGPVPRLPSTVDAALAEFAAQVVPFGFNPGSGRFFGYVPGGGLPSAALGDLLAALTNRYAGVHQACPGAAELENTVIRWLRDLAGLPAGSWGTLTSGGSLATLTALIAARDMRPADARCKSPLYLTGECHHALHKALHIAGMDGVPRRLVATDAGFRMDPADLERQIAADRAAGLNPWIVVASAGTVNSGAVDPLPAIADLAAAHAMWLHVDGAYGGLFALAPSGAPRLKGMERADSLVLDPHKGLFLPYGCGAVLVRDGRRLRASFASSGDYLADVADGDRGEAPSPADVSPELTRHFRGLRLWLSLKIHGLDRFVAALEEKLLLARLAYGTLAETPEVAVGPEPELSCVTFRAAGVPGPETDERTARLLAGILARRRVHLSSTKLRGRLFLRLCVLCFRSHVEAVDEALDEIKTVAKTLASG
jgi:glutamate/tyrosine decarboxylase-like PLP-dependent enzyme